MAVPSVLACFVGHHEHPFEMLSGARETQLVGLQQALHIQLSLDCELAHLTIRRAEDVQRAVVRAEDESPGSLRHVVVLDVHVAWIVVHQLQEHTDRLPRVRPVPWDLIHDDDLLPQVAVEEPSLGSSNRHLQVVQLARRRIAWLLPREHVDSRPCLASPRWTVHPDALCVLDAPRDLALHRT